MRHEMKLFSRNAFDLIELGSKTLEVRLKDEKRSKLQLGDEIVFTREGKTLLVRVVGLCNFKTFEDLFKTIDPVKAGYKKTDTIDYCVEFMNAIYNKEEIDKYGVLGIVIEKI